MKQQIEKAQAPDPMPTRVHRREILSSLTSLFGAAIVGGSVLQPGEAVAGTDAGGGHTTRRRRYGMVIDTRRCVGCRACMIACKAENKTPRGISYTVVVDHVIEPRIDEKPLFMTKPCFHCETPPCVDLCPVSATFKRRQDGIVVVDYDRCMGCRYCMTACPYSARWFDFDENYPAVEACTPYASAPSPEYNQFRVRQRGKSPVGNVRKCTFCMHLQDENGEYDRGSGRWPACAKTCTGHAIHFGDLADPESDVYSLLRQRTAVRLKEELGTQPNVYYLL